MKLINLFSCFDPRSYFGLRLNWFCILIPLLLFKYTFWFGNHTVSIRFFNSRIFNLNQEIKTLINNINGGKTLFFIRLIVFILWINFFGLYPYIFTYSRHFVITLTLALPLWLASLIFGLWNSLRSIIAHLIPLRTTWVLIPFIALAELIRTTIRPATLAIRLATNIVAGHLLLRLLSEQGYSNLNNGLKILIIITQSLLFILEVGVSAVQSYVFSTLSLLYLIETNNH